MTPLPEPTLLGAPAAAPHICVCTCTYKRPVLLRRLIETVAQQRAEGFTFSIVVADNDSARSAERLVANLAPQLAVPIVYCCEPKQNIALVRNRAIENAPGDYIAFIDDDEFPERDWLVNLFQACHRYSAAGVLGPVRPHFDDTPPAWLIKGRFCERPEHPTGTVMPGTKCRTGNVLFRRSILPPGSPPFREEFGTGGEDVDFFRRMNESGHVFVWCNEAVAFETVPQSRWTREYMFKRALLRGRIVLKQRKGRARLVGQSLLAVPLYSLVLPVALLLGQDVFVKYGIRFCDHFGRLLTLVGLNPVNERQM